MIRTDYWGPTHFISPRYSNISWSARSVAALDLLRAFSALFGLTPAADPPEKCWNKALERALANRHSTPATGSEFPITRLGRGYAIRINSRSSGASGGRHVEARFASRRRSSDRRIFPARSCADESCAAFRARTGRSTDSRRVPRDAVRHRVPQDGRRSRRRGP